MSDVAQETNPARLGDIEPARELLRLGQFQSAWASCVEAVSQRPFHPQALLLAAQIAQAAGDVRTARLCVERASRMAPGLAHAVALPPAFGEPSVWEGLDRLIQPASPLRLSVCMIVKNEEAFLDQCLRSVKSAAFQIIVVDTGSTDRTIDIARQHGAEVFCYPWRDDFSAARNAAMLHARGDWILQIDADEEIKPGSLQSLTAELNDPAIIAYEMPLINRGREDEGATLLPRLFRNVPGVAYEGCVHEQILTGVLRFGLEWKLTVRASQAVLVHHGYSPEVTTARDKPRRNLILLRKSLDNPPSDPLALANLYTNLGLETARTGDVPGCIAHYERALVLLNQYVESNRGGLSVSQEFRATFLQQYATYLDRVGRGREVISLYQTPLARLGELSASDHCHLGLAYGHDGQFEQSARHFRQCLDRRHAPTRIPNHPIILGHAPFQCLALALVQANHFAEAEQAFQRGLGEHPNSTELRLEYARFKFRQNRPVEALRDVHALASAHPEKAAIWVLGAEICLAHDPLRDVAMDWTAAALQSHPDDPAMLALRAETLLVSGAPAPAVDLLRPVRKLPSDLDARSLATFILCRLLDESAELPVVEPNIESGASQAFLDLYCRVGKACGPDFIERLRIKIPLVSAILPQAVQAFALAAGADGVSPVSGTK